MTISGGRGAERIFAAPESPKGTVPTGAFRHRLGTPAATAEAMPPNGLDRVSLRSGGAFTLHRSPPCRACEAHSAHGCPDRHRHGFR